MEKFDVIVIGGGPGGYIAAIRAAQLGKKVAIVEKEHLGGVCLNWGCIPTKALLKAAEMFQDIKHAEDYGIKVSSVEFDIGKIVERSRNISSQLTTGIKGLLKKNKVTVIAGAATFIDSKTINIKHLETTTTILGSNIIIATGARAKVLPQFEPDGRLIWTAKEAMIPQVMPKSIIIVGSGAVGIEYASFYNALGAEVTVLEIQNNILPVEDREISTLARSIFENKGIKIYTQAKLLKHTKLTDNILIEVELANKVHTLTAEKLLMAVGITANTETLGLERTKVKLMNGHIVTDQNMRTAEPGVYAIGDVAGAPWLAHKASHEGIMAVQHMTGESSYILKKENIPSCTYSSPQIASVGLTEEVATAKGYQITVGKFPFTANGKALILGKPEGLIKTIFDLKTGEMLGAHMIGAEVTELIQGYVIAKGMEGTELDLIQTIFPHPTLSEMMHESVLQAYKRPLHI